MRHTLILSLKIVWVPTAASVAEQAAPAQLLVEVESGDVSRTDSGVLLLRANVQLRRGSELFRKERYCGLVPTLMHTLVLRQEVVGVALATPVHEQLAPSLFGRGNTNSDLFFMRCACTFWFLSILTIFSYFRHLLVGAKVAYNQDLGLTSCIPSKINIWIFLLSLQLCWLWWSNLHFWHVSYWFPYVRINLMACSFTQLPDRSLFFVQFGLRRIHKYTSLLPFLPLSPNFGLALLMFGSRSNFCSSFQIRRQYIYQLRKWPAVELSHIYLNSVVIISKDFIIALPTILWKSTGVKVVWNKGYYFIPRFSHFGTS